jgi:hypothetical protein
MALKENTGLEHMVRTHGKYEGEVENQGRRPAVMTSNAARSDGRRVAMANHWPPETTALIRHAG